uniref:F-box domain-containing protein n=1 Tax=Rhabditophanes sp. KR3021 TaxID=114890 RepID=A0AC35TG22_9BILA
MVVFAFGLVALVATIAFKVRILYTIYAGVACLLMMAYLAVDIQMIMGGKQYEVSPEDYIFSALQIFMDIINIFMMLLSLLNGTKNFKMNENMKVVLNLPYLFKRCITHFETALALSKTCRSFYNIVGRRQLEFEVAKKRSKVLTLKCINISDSVFMEKDYKDFTFEPAECCGYHVHYDRDQNYELDLMIKTAHIYLNCITPPEYYYGFEAFDTPTIVTPKFLEDNFNYPNLQSIVFDRIKAETPYLFNTLFGKIMNSIISPRITKLAGINYNSFLRFIDPIPTCFVANAPHLKHIEIFFNEKSNLRSTDGYKISSFSKALGNCTFKFNNKVLYHYPMKYGFYSGKKIHIPHNNRDKKNFIKKLEICQRMYEFAKELKSKNVYAIYSTYCHINGNYFVLNDLLHLKQYDFLNYVGFTISDDCTYEAISKMSKHVVLLNNLNEFNVNFDAIVSKTCMYKAYKRLLLSASENIKVLKIGKCPFVDFEFAKQLARRYSNLTSIGIGFYDRARTFVPINYFAEFNELESAFVDFWRTTWIIPSKLRLFVITCKHNEPHKHTFYDQDGLEVELKKKFLVTDDKNANSKQIAYADTFFDWDLYKNICNFNLSTGNIPDYHVKML